MDWKMTVGRKIGRQAAWVEMGAGMTYEQHTNFKREVGTVAFFRERSQARQSLVDRAETEPAILAALCDEIGA